MQKRWQQIGVVAMGVVVLGIAAVGYADHHGAAQANPVAHIVVGELTGCKDPAAVAKVVEEINAEGAENGGPTGRVWRPLHHSGFPGRVAITFITPSLAEYGKQIDRFIGSMSGDNQAPFQKLSACVRIVQRRADEILVAPSVPPDEARVVDRLTYRLKGDCSAAEVVQQVAAGNAWLREQGYQEYGLRWPLFGAEADTIITYAGYPSFASLTQSMAAFRAEAAKPGSAMAKLWVRVSQCMTLTSRISGFRIH